MLEILYSNQATKFLRKSEKTLAKRLLDDIEKLKDQPFPKDIKRVEGHQEKLFRIRVGDYRILYEVDHEGNTVGIIRIDNRERVY